MRYGIGLVLVSAMVLAVGLAGCGEKKTAGEPPIRLGLGPGESVHYEPPAPAVAPAAAEPAPAESVTPEPATATKVITPSKTETTAVVQRMYTIRKGDTLIGLARRFYQDERKWKDIWNANRAAIPNPDVIMPGTEIRLP